MPKTLSDEHTTYDLTCIDDLFLIKQVSGSLELNVLTRCSL